MSRRAITRVLGNAAIVAALVATIRSNFFTVSKILHGSTRVPWMDEWAMIQEFIVWKRGGPLWPILWSSYWGHRLVIPRLVFYADIQWASRASMTWLTLAMQLVQIMLLCALSWALIGRRSRTLFAVSVTVILNLMLSSLQMENFVWSMQFMFPLVYAASGISFLCLALNRDQAHSLFLAVGILAAAVASYTMPNGLLVWPVLVAQAIYLKLERRLTLVIALLGAGIIASYCWHYQTPALGLGLVGMLRRPIDAIMLVGLLLEGTLNSFPLRLGIVTTLLVIVGGIYLGAGALRDRPPEQSWLSALAAFVVFILLSAASMVAGRMPLQWLAAGALAPSRYFTMIQVLWAALGILALYVFCRKPRSPLLIGFFAALYLYLMFFKPQLQTSAAEDWADFFRGADAVGAAFIINAPDEQLLSLLWPVKPQRNEIAEFLRQGHLAFFAEPRATWQGHRVSELFPYASADRCIGSIEKSLPLKDSAVESSWRVEGWAWDSSANRGLDHLLIADSAGLVVGIARGGLRHRYVPGFFTDNPVVPVYHMRFPASEWLGYVRQPARSPWTVYGLREHMNRPCVIIEAGT